MSTGQARRRMIPARVAAQAVTMALVLASTGGCGRNEPAPSPPGTAAGAPAVPVRLLVLDDPQLADAAEREWRAHAEEPLVVQRSTSAEVLARPRLDCDAIIYPSALIGELAQRDWIIPFSAEGLQDPQLAWRDVFPLQRITETHWGKTPVAVPFGSPQLTLMYRLDLFEKLQLSPPTSWSDYQQLVERLVSPDARKTLGVDDHQPWHSVAEPLAEGWAAKVLLARAAAYVRHPAQYSTYFDAATMDPLIEGKQFLRALEELVAAAHLAGNTGQFTPAEAQEALAKGQTALAWSWPGAGSSVEPAATPRLPLAFAELPGSGEAYNFDIHKWEPRDPDADPQVPLLGIAGRLGSVTKEAHRKRQTEIVLSWLCGRDWGSDVARSSAATTFYRISQKSQLAKWVRSGLTDAELGQYFDVVRQTQSRPTSVVALRLPGASRYLAALDAAVRTAVDGSQKPADALHQAAVQWQKITAELGFETQRAAYAQSLGLAP